MEFKLTNVDRASLEEVLADYRNFLRVRDFTIWDKGSKEAQFVRHLSHGTTSPTASTWRLVRPGSWPTSPSASSTKPTTSSPSRFAVWNRHTKTYRIYFCSKNDTNWFCSRRLVQKRVPSNARARAAQGMRTRSSIFGSIGLGSSRACQ